MTKTLLAAGAILNLALAIFNVHLRVQFNAYCGLLSAFASGFAAHCLMRILIREGKL